MKKDGRTTDEITAVSGGAVVFQAAVVNDGSNYIRYQAQYDPRGILVSLFYQVQVANNSLLVKKF